MRTIEHPAKTPSAKTGRLASLASLLRARGSGAPALRLPAPLALAAIALLAIPASALAARGHVFDESLTLGSPCTVEPCAPGTLKEPSGVAVNEATGEVYVVDEALERVEIYDAVSGAFLAQIDGSTTPSGNFHSLVGIAVDNTCAIKELTASTSPTCAEADPSNGDLYLVDNREEGGPQVVDKFEQDGTFLNQVTGLPENQLLAGVAIGSSGQVWINSQAAPNYGYDNAVENQPTQVVEAGHAGEYGFENSLAVDSDGNFYIKTLSNGNETVHKFSPTGGILIPSMTGENPASAVGVDQSTDIAYVGEISFVGVFNSEGTEVERLAPGEGNPPLQHAADVASDSRTETVFVSDRKAGVVVAFSPEPPGPPTVEAESQFVSDVGAESAILHAQLNPRSNPGDEPTHYYFQYGPCASLLTCSSEPFPLSTSMATAPPDFEVHKVQATIQGLQPGVIYHYRLVATNAHGTAEGESLAGSELSRTFTTQTSIVSGLPDGRSWELVSPPHKAGAAIEPIGETGVTKAAADGHGIAYILNGPIEGEPFGYAARSQALSLRSPSEWSSRDISVPHQHVTGNPVGQGPESKDYSSDLSHALVRPYGQYNPSLSDESSEPTPYLRDLSPACTTNCFHPLVTAKPGFADVPAGTEFGEDAKCASDQGGGVQTVCGPGVEAETEDLKHVVIRSAVPLVSGAGEQQLYEWEDGSLELVSIFPPSASGEPSSVGVGAGSSSVPSARSSGAISADGSRVIWHGESSGEEALYQRDRSSGSTAQLDEGTGCEGCGSGYGVYQAANRDGSTIIFADAQPLTADSGAHFDGPHSGQNSFDLYRCAMVMEAGEPHCQLTDLTPLRNGEPADVQGHILGSDTGADHFYFVAEGVLSGPNGEGQAPALGRSNLYSLQGEEITFIGILVKGDANSWGGQLPDEAFARQPAMASPDGRYLTFMSQARLVDYENKDAMTGDPVAEVYLYDSATGHLSCPSCDPTGVRPNGVGFRELELDGTLSPGAGFWGGGAVAAFIPAAEQADLAGGFVYQPRSLDDSGRLFFTSGEALVPQDSNGTQDVYEFEPASVGGCTEVSPTYSQSIAGCVYLISSGTSRDPSSFLDASADGADVFFLTSSQLRPQDEDSAKDIYDAHVCSAATPCLPEPPAPAPACEGDACQQPATPPVDATPNSLSFHGAGNVREARAKKKKRRSRKHRSHHKKHRKTHKRAAHRDAGASK